MLLCYYGAWYDTYLVLESFYFGNSILGMIFVVVNLVF